MIIPHFPWGHAPGSLRLSCYAAEFVYATQDLQVVTTYVCTVYNFMTATTGVLVGL